MDDVHVRQPIENCPQNTNSNSDRITGSIRLGIDSDGSGCSSTPDLKFRSGATKATGPTCPCPAARRRRLRARHGAAHRVHACSMGGGLTRRTVADNRGPAVPPSVSAPIEDHATQVTLQLALAGYGRAAGITCLPESAGKGGGCRLSSPARPHRQRVCMHHGSRLGLPAGGEEIGPKSVESLSPDPHNLFGGSSLFGGPSVRDCSGRLPFVEVDLRSFALRGQNSPRSGKCPLPRWPMSGGAASGNLWKPPDSPTAANS